MSALLIISATVVYRQVNYLHHTNLGFNEDRLLYFPAHGIIFTNLDAFKSELKQSPEIVTVTGGYGLPVDLYAGDQKIIPGKDGDRTIGANLFIVDHDYLKTLGLELIAGRNFFKGMATEADEGGHCSRMHGPFRISSIQCRTKE